MSVSLLADMAIQQSSGPPPREHVHFQIPDSTISMSITLKGDQAIPSHDVHACLLGALEQTRKYPEHDLVFRFRYSPPVPASVSVALMGGFWHNDLTYGDVATVLRGLQTFLAARNEYVALLYFLEDEHRSAIGDGNLMPNRVEVNESAEIVGASGSILQIQESESTEAVRASESTS